MCLQWFSEIKSPIYLRFLTYFFSFKKIVATKKGKTTHFPPSFFVAVVVSGIRDPGSKIRDPGSGMEKNQDLGAVINIPDP